MPAQKFEEEKSNRRLSALQHKEAEESTKRLAASSGMNYVDLSLVAIEIDALKTLPEAKARAGELAVYQATGKHVKIALRNPKKAEAIAILQELTARRYTYELTLASLYSLNTAWSMYERVPEAGERYIGAIALSMETLTTMQQQLKSITDIKARAEQTFYGRTTQALEVLLGGALATDASDMHIEPQADGVRVRLRLDGVLHDVVMMPSKLYVLLLSRIKLISELKLNVHDRAQDGRFTIKLEHTAVEVRTSVLPGPDGENIVMRLLNPKSIDITIPELGMQPWVVKIIQRELERPNGLILTTGPTGSGKTTTLYTFLRTVHDPSIKVITIEDPIEYHLTGIEQTQVEPEKGYDFANGLRAIVRQDPDVILVGEIRDLETAETAMHAALTGHLVLSTLHTNDAAGTIPRLIDLGVRPAIIAPAINVAMAQRLVRRLCTDCRQAAPPASAPYEALKKDLALMPAGVPIPAEAQWTVFTPKKDGCPACGGIGYKGRIGIYEIILIDDKLEELILESAPESEIKKQAVVQGQITMRQDGLLKVAAGITDLDELDRTVG